MIPNLAHVEIIAHAVSAETGVRMKYLRGPQTAPCYTQPRMIAWWLCRQLTSVSHPAIGDYFNRDHSTVIAGVRRVERLLASDARTVLLVLRLRTQLEQALIARDAGVTEAA